MPLLRCWQALSLFLRLPAARAIRVIRLFTVLGSAGSTGTAGEANSSAGITNEAGTISATGVTNGVFVPDDNINEDVYGPPADME